MTLDHRKAFKRSEDLTFDHHKLLTLSEGHGHQTVQANITGTHH